VRSAGNGVFRRSERQGGKGGPSSFSVACSPAGPLSLFLSANDLAIRKLHRAWKCANRDVLSSNVKRGRRGRGNRAERNIVRFDNRSLVEISREKMAFSASARVRRKTKGDSSETDAVSAARLPKSVA